jgi:hypothetical protein
VCSASPPAGVADVDPPGGDLTENDLVHVSIKLRGGGDAPGERNAQLRRLFEACGLDSNFKGPCPRRNPHEHPRADTRSTESSARGVTVG